MIKTCKICGKQFEGSGKAAYCSGPHYKACEVCGNLFEWDHKNPKKCCSKKCSALLRKSSIESTVRVCELCGKKFHPRSNTQRYCEDDHFKPCPICGSPVKVLAEYDSARCCSIECTTKLRQKTCESIYGVKVASQSDEVKAKIRESALSESTVAKRRQTSMQNWGVSNPSQHPDVQKKISETIRSKDCRNRTRVTTLERFGVPYAMQSERGMSRYKQTIQEKYGVPYYCMTDDCRQSAGDIISSINRAVGQRLNEFSIPYKFETRLDNYSYDIQIQDSNILLEIDPTYTHNAVGNHWGKGLDKYYHRDKSKLAEKYGYRCIHIFDWDSIDKIVNMLKPKIPRYARNCEIVELDAEVVSTFEDLYHLQGRVRRQKICLGLYLNNELIQVMTFGAPRYNKNYEWELLRLCSDSRYAVVGGAEKLWKYFIHNYNPNSVISYCDVAKFSGQVYSRLGMILKNVVEPNKIWSKGGEMITGNLLLQRGYDQLFHTNYGKGTDNEQLMLDHGWLPVYDCGQSVYEYLKSEAAR